MTVIARAAEADEGEVGEDPGDEIGRMPGPATRGMFQRFLDLQAQEVSIRAQEVQVRQLEVRAGYKYSKASLDAQERDLRDERIERRTKRRDQFFFIAFSLLLLTGLLVYLLQSGNTELAREILKALVYIAMAGTSGFYAGKVTERQKRQAEEEWTRGARMERPASFLRFSTATMVARRLAARPTTAAPPR
jgi:hypothetical protein